MVSDADVCNLAFDTLGTGIVIGSVLDGTLESELARRWYGRELRALLRAANWSFARKRAPLQILGDATGQTPGTSTIVENPWLYAYAWPIDGVRIRWLPWSNYAPQGLATAPSFPPQAGQISLSVGVPPMPNLNVPPAILFPMGYPARFLCSVSDQYPVEIGPQPWDSLPDLDNIEGVGPNSRRIILTNVPPFGAFGAQAGAQAVYTFLCLEIEVWDDQFHQAFVAVLASRFAMHAIAGKADATDRDKARALAERNAQIAIAKNMIRDARIASSQEAGWPQSINREASWVRARRTGYSVGYSRWGGWGDDGLGAGPGYSYMDWGQMGFADGSVF
jgi:hypothetical protein